MSPEWTALMITAASIGFFHTLLGPDHYLPFIVMAKARQWSLLKTASITVLCGIGHVGSSVLLGLVGIAFGIAVGQLVAIESFRGDLAAWALIAFGFVYLIWGLRKAWRMKPHQHPHTHEDGTTHLHRHTHLSRHAHVHDKPGEITLTPWVLFTVFVLGPCEPLIPILMYPAARDSYTAMFWVSLTFGSVTIATMLSIVIAAARGIQFVPLHALERYTHALAGGAICLCGLAIQFLGL